MKNHGFFALLIIVGFVILGFLVFTGLAIFLFGIRILNLDSLLPDLFLVLFGVFKVVIVDEFVHIFVWILFDRGILFDLLQRLVHFFAFKVLLNVFNCLLFEGAFLFHTILDIFGYFVNVSESDHTVNYF